MTERKNTRPRIMTPSVWANQTLGGKEEYIKAYGRMRRGMSLYEKEVRPEGFDEWHIDDRLEDIVKRLQFISTRDHYKDIRRRYASEQQYEEEFGDESGYEETITKLWFSAKEDYYSNKNEYDTYLEENPKSEGFMNNINAMRKVIDDEIEEILLKDLTDSI